MERAGDRRTAARPPRKPEPRPEPEPPLPLDLSILPDEKGRPVAGPANPGHGPRLSALWYRAAYFCKKPERQQVRFDVKKNPEGKSLQLFSSCAHWMTRSSSPRMKLSNMFWPGISRHLLQVERTANCRRRAAPPVCRPVRVEREDFGLPPNYHDYQTQLHKLATERFAQRMPFEAFKARVKIVRDRGRCQTMDRGSQFQDRIQLPECAGAEEVRRPGGGRAAFPVGFIWLISSRAWKPTPSAGSPAQRALAGIAAGRAHDVGRPAPLSLASGHNAEPAVRRARAAVLLGRPHGDPRVRRAPAFS